uniref:Uncharacterized protein n=1 Tax=Cacopsylla melanoneura TaxID=428564 RepID=A0A8D9B2D6_9HEMI
MSKYFIIEQECNLFILSLLGLKGRYMLPSFTLQLHGISYLQLDCPQGIGYVTRYPPLHYTSMVIRIKKCPKCPDTVILFQVNCHVCITSLYSLSLSPHTISLSHSLYLFLLHIP